mmetsp:Transcript_15218/g.35255  ORF Transcript_15218/g.35255 Transcript_15218/m.35255 type:complete len:118 (+) Transcript_15218:736-1089(+)
MQSYRVNKTCDAAKNPEKATHIGHTNIDSNFTADPINTARPQDHSTKKPRRLNQHEIVANAPNGTRMVSAPSPISTTFRETYMAHQNENTTVAKSIHLQMLLMHDRKNSPMYIATPQ